MKTVDYSFNGGLPFSQDTLKFMQEGYKDVLTAFCERGYVAGGDPMIIVGCEHVGANVYNPGWIYDGIEPTYFPGGDASGLALPTATLKTYNTIVVFGDGANRNLRVNKQYEFDAAGAVRIDLIKRWGISAQASFAFNLPEAQGTIYIRVNKLARLMYIEGYYETVSADTYASDGLRVQLIDSATLEANAIYALGEPATNRDFMGIVRAPGSGVYKDTSNVAITNVPMQLTGSGLYVALRKAAAGTSVYPIWVSAVLSID